MKIKIPHLLCLTLMASILSSCVSDELSMTHTPNFSFTLDEVTTKAIDVGGRLTIANTSTLEIDASGYKGGPASISLLTYTNRSGAFLPKNVRVNGLQLNGKGLVGSITYDDDSMDLVLSKAYSDTAEGLVGQKNITFSWDHVSRGLYIAQNTEFTAEEFDYFAANYSVITFAINYASKNYRNYDLAIAKAAKELKARNANIKVLYYINLARIINHYPANKEFLANPEWSEKSITKNLNAPYLNWANRDAAQWWVNRVADVYDMPNIDGIFVDGIIQSIGGRARQFGPDWENGIFWAFQQMNIVAQKSAKNPIIMGNIIRYNKNLAMDNIAPYFNSSFLENHHFEVDENTLQETYANPTDLRRLIARTDDFAKDGKLILTYIGLGDAGGGLGSLSDSKVMTVLENLAEKRLAFFLLTAQKNSFYDYKEGQRPPALFRLDKLAEFTRPLGKPLGDMTQNDGTFTREFEHCTVTVNTDNMLQTGIICR